MYITPDKRAQLDSIIKTLVFSLASMELDDEDNDMAANIGYVVKKTLLDVYGNTNAIQSRSATEALGLLEHTKLDFYASVMKQMDNQSKHDNGDIEVQQDGGEVVGIVDIVLDHDKS